MSRLVSRRLRGAIQVSGMVRKEVVQTLRQPQLLFLLVAGPFIILVIFGFGYDEEQMALRTRFVGTEGSIYQSAVSDYADLLGDYIVPDGWSTDLVGSRDELARGELDLVVVFPTDAPAQLSEGVQAPITIFHDKIDPLQRTAVEIASRLAVGEVNATVLEALIDRGLEGLRPVTTYLDEATVVTQELESAAARSDASEVESLLNRLADSLAGAETTVAASATVLGQLDVEGTADPAAELQAIRDDLRSARATADRYAAEARGGTVPSGINQLASQVNDITSAAEVAVNVPPEVIVRPFVSEVAQIGAQRVTPTDFFAPATIALLLAHLGVTFSAMSVVADRRLGVFETYRVAPLGVVQVLASKYVAFVLLGGLVGAALLAAVVFGLGVPMIGVVAWLIVIVAGLLVASVGLGLIVSALARSDSQAVQYAMLLLLAGLFFGGFFLELSAFAAPVQALAHALPVTYGISMLHDTMLRGIDPATTDLIGLGALIVVYGLGASVLTRWQLRA